MDADGLHVDALLRGPSAQEIAEGLERNPGSVRLHDRGWAPLWFEARVLRGDGEEIEHVHSLVWREPGRTLEELAEEELELALDEVLRNLRDLEGLDVWAEDVVTRSLRVDAR